MNQSLPTNYNLQSTKSPKVAILCDWLTGVGGAERVVLELHRMFPDAPIYTSQYDPKAIDWFKDADVRTGWLQKIPVGLKKFLPLLRAYYFSHLDLSQYDLIISNNYGAESKAVKFGKNTTHICICNAPTHYYWSRYDAYIKNPGFPVGFNWLARLGLKVLVNPMRRWDYKAAQKPTKLIAISTHIQQEIKKYYDRESTVIHPPVETARFQLSATSNQPPARSGFVVTSRQTPYKRVDLAVAACSKLGLPLTVIGSGPEHEKLVQIAGPTIKFIENATDTQVAQLLGTAEAFIFSGLDDFGIAPIEAMASGTPVIAYKAGGALDYIVPNKTGLFFEDQTIESLVGVIHNFKAISFDSSIVSESARRFSSEAFRTTLQNFIDSVIQNTD